MVCLCTWLPTKQSFLVSLSFSSFWAAQVHFSYQTAGCRIVRALASDLKGDIVGSVVLELESSGSQVVEVFVEQLRFEC